MTAWLLVALAVAGPDAGAEAPGPEVVAACDAAVEARDEAGLQACVEAWVYADAHDPLTDWYAFHLALLQENPTAAVSARNRALAHGLDETRARAMGRAELPPNPMLTVQRVFLAVILSLGGVGMVWARFRAMRDTPG